MLLLAFTAAFSQPVQAQDGLAQIDRLQPEVYTFERVQVIPDEAATLYVQIYGESVFCDLSISIQDTGDVAHVSALDCPNSLLNSARAGVWDWSFHAPSIEGRAVHASHTVTLEYRANTVVTAAPSSDDYMLVRVAPAAVPRWQVELNELRWAKRYLADSGLDSATCTGIVSLKRTGILDTFEATDCPVELADPIEKLGKRWGFDVIGDGEEMEQFELSVTFE